MMGQSDKAPYSFFVAGHTYGIPGDRGIHPPFREKFAYIDSRPEIKFGVFNGDIVAPNPTAADWDAVDSDLDSLNVPVYFAVGNHDSEDRQLFESRYGPTYYYFNYDKDLYIVLDPNLDAWNISGDQLIFLRNLIDEEAPFAQNIFVFFHQILWKEKENPFKYISWNSTEGRGDTINFWSEVEPIFHQLPNQIYMFAGDLGASWSNNITYDHYENITLIATGMGDPDGENFIVVNVDDNKQVTYDLVCLSDTNLFCLGELTDYLRVDQLVASHAFVDKGPAIIFPNPAFDRITITIPDLACTDIRIYNGLGAQVYQRKCRALSNEIDIQTYPSGIYSIIVQTSRGHYNSKFIVS